MSESEEGAMTERELEEIEKQIQTLLNTPFRERLGFPQLVAEVRRSHAEAAELRRKVAEMERVLRAEKEALQAVARGEFGLQDAVRACHEIDATLSQAKLKNQEGE